MHIIIQNSRRIPMARLLMAVALVVMVFAVVVPASAQSEKMWLGAGFDVLMPMGTFSDVNGVGFGGTARFQYNFLPEAAGGVEAGYFTWGGKDYTGTFGQGTVKGPSFGGVPFRIFGKYYFMKNPKSWRPYGKLA